MAERLDAQQRELERLNAATRPGARAGTGPATTSRRAMLGRLIGATAAATVLAVAKEAPRADAFGTGTIVAASSTADYGIIARPGQQAPVISAGSSPGAGVVGTTDTSTPAPYPGGGPAGVFGTAQAAHGVVGASASGTGVRGESGSGTGVRGNSDTAFGVFGFTAAAAGSSVAAVKGASIDVIGVHGTSTNAAGVRGENFSTSNSVPGVLGTATKGPGLQGSSTDGFGVHGQSTNNHGIVGQGGPSAAGCFGVTANGFGLYGAAVAGGTGFAGAFSGPVFINGSYTATGAKSAAVPHPDGSHRRLYCQESPEPWFEDFGEGKLQNGRAEVKLDGDFAAVVHSDKYLVYLTPEGDSKGLFVANKTPNGFEVREAQGGTASLGFSYRVVAKRKDIPGPRLERVNLPKPPEVKDLPKPPEPVKPVEEPGRRRPDERPGQAPAP